MTGINTHYPYLYHIGYEIPRFGFGVAYGYGKEEDPLELTVPGVLEAFKVGYRHIDSAQLYRNEREVGQALRKSGINREDVYISRLSRPIQTSES